MKVKGSWTTYVVKRGQTNSDLTELQNPSRGFATALRRNGGTVPAK